MRWRRVVIALSVAALVGAAGWWLWPAEGEGAAGPGEGARVAEGAQGPGPTGTERLAVGDDGGAWVLRGRIVDEDRSPVAGARVVAWAPAGVPVMGESCEACGASLPDCEDPASARKVIARARAGLAVPAAIAEASSDAQGRFVLEGLPGRELEVTARTPEAMASLSSGALPEGDGEVELVLAPTRSRTLGIVDELGAPVPGVPVILAALEAGEVREVESDARGQVTFALPGTEVWAGVDAPGWLPVGRMLGGGSLQLSRPRTLIVRTRSAGRPIDAEVRLDLHAERVLRAVQGEVRVTGLPADQVVEIVAKTAELSADRTLVQLDQLETVVTLELRRAASLAVVVVDAQGQAVEDPWVDLEGSSLQGVRPGDTVGDRTTWDALPEGDYELTVSARGYFDARRRVDLSPGKHEVKVVLRARPMLRGTVVDERGTPVEGATVEADERNAYEGPVVTDETGRFEIELLADAPTEVSAWSSEVGRATAIGRSGQEVTLRLEPAAAVELTLLDVDRQVVTDETIVIRHLASERLRDGLSRDPFARIVGLEPGRSEISVDYAGRLPLRLTVDLVRGQVARLTLQLEAGESVEGRVVDASGAPQEGMDVYSPGVAASTTDAQGRFSITGLPAGELQLIARGPAGRGEVTVTAPARGVELRLAPSFRVRGRVEDEAGRPLRRFDVENQTVDSADGRFEVMLEQGQASIAAEGFATAILDLDREADVGVIRLRRLGVVRGQVFGDGRPLAGARVLLEDSLAETTSDAEGRFELAVEQYVTSPVTVFGRRGGFSGRVTASPGAQVRLELSRGTHVEGRVIDESGRATPNEITFELATSGVESLSVTTDERGRFEADLVPGEWLVTLRQGAARRVTVAGARQELTLVDSRACQLVLDAPRVELAWLVPQDLADAPARWAAAEGIPTGTIEATLGDGPVATAVPCARYVLVAVRDDDVVARVPVAFTDGQAHVRVPPAPAP